MDIVRIGKENLRIQKQYFAILFDNMNLFHKYLENVHDYCVYHGGGYNRLLSAVSHNWAVLKNNLDDMRRVMDENFSNMERCLNRLHSDR